MPIAVVGGAIANKPLNGGESWVRLSWIIGLRRLGYDVYFFERLRPGTCVDAAGRPAPVLRSANLAQLRRVAAEFGLGDRIGLVDDEGGRIYGLGADALDDLVAEADVVFDLSGNLGPLALRTGARRGAARRGPSVFVDLDPGFTQIWHTDPGLPFSVAGYDRHVTVALNLGAGGCRIPTGGLDWLPTLPPVLLDEWESPPPRAGVDAAAPFRLTTVSTWRTAHGPVELGGRTLGLKHHELRRLSELPWQVAGAEFELALDIDESDARDRAAMEANAWHIVPARACTGTPASFRDYVRGSCAELSAAQPAYVETGSGWFSDRTAAYLAAGRPAVVQDTGLGRRLPVGEGLLTFGSPREAVRRVRRLVSEPRTHAEAARAFAAAHLDSDLVLGRLLERLGVGGREVSAA